MPSKNRAGANCCKGCIRVLSGKQLTSWYDDQDDELFTALNGKPTPDWNGWSVFDSADLPIPLVLDGNDHVVLQPGDYIKFNLNAGNYWAIFWEVAPGSGAFPNQYTLTTEHGESQVLEFQSITSWIRCGGNIECAEELDPAAVTTSLAGQIRKCDDTLYKTEIKGWDFQPVAEPDVTYYTTETTTTTGTESGWVKIQNTGINEGKIHYVIMIGERKDTPDEGCRRCTPLESNCVTPCPCEDNVDFQLEVVIEGHVCKKRITRIVDGDTYDYEIEYDATGLSGTYILTGGINCETNCFQITGNLPEFPDIVKTTRSWFTPEGGEPTEGPTDISNVPFTGFEFCQYPCDETHSYFAVVGLQPAFVGFSWGYLTDPDDVQWLDAGILFGGTFQTLGTRPTGACNDIRSAEPPYNENCSTYTRGPTQTIGIITYNVSGYLCCQLLSITSITKT